MKKLLPLIAGLLIMSNSFAITKNHTVKLNTGIEENYMHHTEKNVVTGMVRGKPIAVDSLAPNAFGLYNMHGNVSEWVFDFYGTYEKSKNPNCIFQLFRKHPERRRIYS